MSKFATTAITNPATTTSQERTAEYSRQVAVIVGASVFVALCARITIPLMPLTPVPLTVRNLGVLLVGMLLTAMRSALGIQIILLGVLLYCGVLVFQVINLPVEFDASNRAKRILRDYQIVDGEGAIAVDRVLNAAALTYIAATLQTLLVISYYLFRILGSRRD